jgi:hypothetical protein
MLIRRKQVVGLTGMVLFVGLASQAQSAPDDPGLNILQRGIWVARTAGAI